MNKQTVDEIVDSLVKQLDSNQQKWTFEYFSTPQEENVKEILTHKLTKALQQEGERVRGIVSKLRKKYDNNLELQGNDLILKLETLDDVENLTKNNHE